MEKKIEERINEFRTRSNVTSFRNITTGTTNIHKSNNNLSYHYDLHNEYPSRRALANSYKTSSSNISLMNDSTKYMKKKVRRVTKDNKENNISYLANEVRSINKKLIALNSRLAESEFKYSMQIIID